MELYLIIKKAIKCIFNSDTIESIGVISSLIISIITLRNSKKVQLDQQKEIENNRFEEQRGILQIYTVTNNISSTLDVDCMIVRNIGRSPLKITKFIPDDEFLKLETEFWEKFNLSKPNIWMAPGQTYRYLCNSNEIINKKENNLEIFSIYCEYETLGRRFEEKINGLSYKHGDPIKIISESKSIKKTLEEIKYQLYIMNIKKH